MVFYCTHPDNKSFSNPCTFKGKHHHFPIFYDISSFYKEGKDINNFEKETNRETATTTHTHFVFSFNFHLAGLDVLFNSRQLHLRTVPTKYKHL